jgi:uncharacterized protein (TIGR02145 family)
MKLLYSIKPNVILLTQLLVFLLTTFVACKKDDAASSQSQNNGNTTVPIVVCDNQQEGEMIPSVIIGTQEWMSENLSATCYSDGTPIPNVTDYAEWNSLMTGAWCWYMNDSATFAQSYGRLYNWYAVAGINSSVAQNDPSLRKKLAPSGWHVPSSVEWDTMINFLDPNADGDCSPLEENCNIAGGMLKATGTVELGTGLWFSPNTMATNSTGFSGMPCGARGGNFHLAGQRTYWWTSSASGPETAWIRFVTNVDGSIYKEGAYMDSGLSVRCVKD